MTNTKATAKLRQINKELNGLRWEPPLTKAAAILGRKGGLSRSEAKVRAAKENGKRGGRTPKLADLNRFFWEVARLTAMHDSIGDSAVVYPSKLGEALERIDPEWFKHLAEHVEF